MSSRLLSSIAASSEEIMFSPVCLVCLFVSKDYTTKSIKPVCTASGSRMRKTHYSLLPLHLEDICRILFYHLTPITTYNFDLAF